MKLERSKHPEIGWFKERFKILTRTDELLEFECFMSGKGRVPKHYHKDCDEEFTALDGTLLVNIGKESHTLSPSQTIIAPMGVVHSLRNPSKDPIRFKVVMKPNHGMSDLFDILVYLKENYPEKKYSIVTAMYILRKLDLKAFSTPVGGNYIFEESAYLLVNLLAPLLGWTNLAKEYSKHIQ